MYLIDYNTREVIRPATLDEWAESILAAERDGGAGAIRIERGMDDRTVYVEGGPADLVQRIETLATEAAAAGDLDGHALYTSPDGARPAIVHIAEVILSGF